MAQASVLTVSDIRRVFRIIETTRHAERNRLAFILSIYRSLNPSNSGLVTARHPLAQVVSMSQRSVKFRPCSDL
jgi:hypothetical protein